MHAAAGHLQDLLHRIRLGGVDEVGGAELAGEVVLGAEHVHGDDPAGAGDGRAVDRRQADAAAADDRHGLAGPDARGMDGGAHAGHHRASDQGGAVQGHVLADRDAGVLVDQHVLGEGGQVQELRQGRAVLGQAGLIAGLTLGLGADAERQPAGQAAFTVAAIGGQAGDDMVARLHGADFRAHSLDDAGALVAQDGGKRVRVGALHEVEVGVAQTCGLGADEDLARTGLVDLDVFNLKRLAHFAQNGGLHVGISPSLAPAGVYDAPA